MVELKDCRWKRRENEMGILSIKQVVSSACQVSLVLKEACVGRGHYHLSLSIALFYIKPIRRSSIFLQAEEKM